MILTLLTSCVNKKEYFSKTYEGTSMETLWTYHYKDNGEFIFKTEGHYGFTEEGGHYTLLDSIILLNPDTDWSTLDGVLKTRLKVVSPNCIRDYDNNFYCVKIDSVYEKMDTELSFELKVIELLDTMILVKDEREKWSRNLVDKVLEFGIEYQFIIKVDNQEYHRFDLVRHQGIVDEWHDLRFLVKKRPLEIYQHKISGDSLTLIYKGGED